MNRSFFLKFVIEAIDDFINGLAYGLSDALPPVSRVTLISVTFDQVGAMSFG